MVKTNSMFVELGTSLPFFEILNVNSIHNNKLSSSNLDERHLLIMFICAHCPFVKHIEKEISNLTKDIETKVQTIAISSNDINTHPGDSPENLRQQAKINGWTFPYLFDEDQSFARKLKAACTPDFYLFSHKVNTNFSLFYHGQLDKSRPSNNLEVNGEDLRLAINAMIEKKEYTRNQIPSLGCNIKWSVGKEPEWFK